MSTIFTGDYNWMKNGYPCQVKFDGMTYPSVEHAFQASKTLSLSDREKIASVSSIKEALEIGRSVELAQGWGHSRLRIMEFLLNEKYKNNDELGKKLMETGSDQILANMGNDFWGTGYDGSGHNYLGKLHEKIRSELQIANSWSSGSEEEMTHQPLKPLEKKVVEKAIANTAKAKKPEPVNPLDESFGINNGTSLTTKDKEEFDSWLK